MTQIPFNITRLDRFAQGVSLGDKVTFVRRALPGEQGVAHVYKSAKGVQFASIVSLTDSSKERMKPSCPHYNECQGCHFLHVGYKSELEYKKESLEFELKNYLGETPVEILSGPRFSYRNRIQLHYHIKNKELGYINPLTKKIQRVDQCLLGNAEISAAMKSLYEDDIWIQTAKRHKKPSGHVELYFRHDNVYETWNQTYASEGFSQVNTNLNLELSKWIEERILNKYFKESEPFVFDLFGGGGNLSNIFKTNKRLIIDMYRKSTVLPYYSFDMESEKIVLPEGYHHCDLMIIDPPRRGFLKVEEWTTTYKPQYILYVSCDVSSLKRDLAKLTDYTISETLLVDFFAGTYHYESLVFLERI